MFPYIDSAGWHIGGYALNPFALLVAIGAAVGYRLAIRRAVRSGIERERFTHLGLCVIAAGFIGGHVAVFAYSPLPRRVLAAHPLASLNVFNGLASFGAFLGGYLAALLFLRWHSIPYARWYVYADVGCFTLPFAWWIGRVGCYLVHDHPGVRTASFLGVRYPGGTRYDLGLLETLFLLALAAAFRFLDRRPRPRGFFYIAFLISYGLFRWGLDRLHEHPPRYGGWTVDEIGAGLMLFAAAAGILDLLRLNRAQKGRIPT